MPPPAGISDLCRAAAAIMLRNSWDVETVSLSLRQKPDALHFFAGSSLNMLAGEVVD